MAQPNLMIQSLPAPFTRFSMYVCDTTGIRVGAPGIGQVWSYSNLLRRGSDTTLTIHTDKTILKSPVREKFPNAEVVVVDDTTTSVFRTINGQWRLEGWITPNSEMVAGADPYDVRPVEVVVNNPKYDVFNGIITTPFPTPGPKTVTGSHSYVYDGYGQLILPDNSYDNVARITQRDTMSVDVTIGPQKAFVKTFSRKTSWQEITNDIPLLVIDESTIQVVNTSNVSLFGPFTFKTVRYLRKFLFTGVKEEPNEALLIAPSPSSSDVLTISGIDADPAHVVVINTIGQTVECAVSRTVAGLTLDVHELALGTYHVLIMDGGLLRTASFVRK
jgi:hypothetical protein